MVRHNILSANIFFSDRPQMVRLHRVPNEFNTSKMRDSFMRQFVEQGSENNVMIGALEDSDDMKTVLLGGTMPLLAECRHKCITEAPAIKTGIGNLLRLEKSK